MISDSFAARSRAVAGRAAPITASGPMSRRPADRRFPRPSTGGALKLPIPRRADAAERMGGARRRSSDAEGLPSVEVGGREPIHAVGVSRIAWRVRVGYDIIEDNYSKGNRHRSDDPRRHALAHCRLTSNSLTQDKSSTTRTSSENCEEAGALAVYRSLLRAGAAMGICIY